MLIITQKVNKNDSVLGFFHDWIIEFAKHVPKLTVICLEKGEYDLPSNVEVISLGKEKGYTKVKLLIRLCYLVLTKKYDKVFVHMNPEYVVLFGWLWRIFRKEISLWYTHKSVNLKLKVAVFFAHRIFSASPESFRFKTKKLKVMGHGIDSSVFYPAQNFPQKVHIISAGRISETKNYEPFLDAISLLDQENTFSFHVSIAGGPVSVADEVYLNKLQTLCRSKNIEHIVSFVGPIPYREVSDFYRQGTIFVNLSNTGSLDKAVLEAMACGLSVVTSNEAFQNLIDSKYLTTNNPETIKNTIKKFFDIGCGNDAIAYVQKNHSLTKLIQHIDDDFIHPKQVCFFGIYDPGYSRNRVLVRGLEENGYRVVECSVDPKKYSGFRKFIQLYKEWKRVKHNNFSFCIVGFPGHSVVWFAILLFGRKKVIFDFFVSLFNSNIEDREQYKKISFKGLYMWFLDYFSLLISRRILIDTYAHRDFISKKFFVRRKKFQVVYVGSDDSVVFPKKFQKEIDKFIVHFHGTNTPLQGFSVIQQAAKILESHKNIEFHIYGFSGEDTTNLKFFPRFPYEKMSDILSRADIVLGIFGTTKKAGKVIPNKVFEGLAAQKPVITRKSKAVFELFYEKPPMVLCRKGDSQSLSQAISLLAASKTLRNRYAEEGYLYFKEHLTPKILVASLLKNYR